MPSISISTERSEQKADERSECRAAFAVAFAFSRIHPGSHRKIAPRIEQSEIQ